MVFKAQGSGTDEVFQSSSGTWATILHGTTILTLPAQLNAYNASPAVLTTYDASALTNDIFLSAGGNTLSYCPTLACVTSPNADHQRTSSLFWATTADDGHSEEQTLAIETIIGTGYAKTWAQSTTFNVGDNIAFGTANTVYRQTVSPTCLSSSTGTGPTGTGTGIVDGTCHWNWINAAAIDAKVGVYNETVVIPGAGHSWSQANNMQLQSGVTPQFMVNTELDLTNNSGTDCTTGGVNCIGEFIQVQGANINTAGLNTKHGRCLGKRQGSSWAIWLSGAHLASLADIEDDASAAVGINFGSSGAHTTATIYDNSAGVVSLYMNGTKTGEDINDTSTSPAAFANSGAHTIATFYDNSTSTIGIDLVGTYATAAISTPGKIIAGSYVIGTALVISGIAPTFTSGACVGAIGTATSTAAFTFTTGSGSCGSTSNVRNADRDDGMGLRREGRIRRSSVPHPRNL